MGQDSTTTSVPTTAIQGGVHAGRNTTPFFLPCFPSTVEDLCPILLLDAHGRYAPSSSEPMSRMPHKPTPLPTGLRGDGKRQGCMSPNSRHALFSGNFRDCFVEKEEKLCGSGGWRQTHLTPAYLYLTRRERRMGGGCTIRYSGRRAEKDSLHPTLRLPTTHMHTPTYYHPNCTAGKMNIW